MLRAAISGAIDYSMARSSDPLWLAFEEAVLAELRAQYEVEVARVSSLATISSVAMLAAGGSKEAVKAMVHALDGIDAAEIQYYPPFAGNGKTDAAARGKSSWERAYGPMSDPEVMRKVKESEKVLMDRQKKAMAQRAADRMSARRLSSASQRKNGRRS